jgi:hypothetical protein
MNYKKRRRNTNVDHKTSMNELQKTGRKKKENINVDHKTSMGRVTEKSGEEIHT